MSIVACAGVSTVAAIASVKLATMMFNMNYDAARDVHEINERIARLETMMTAMAKNLSPVLKAHAAASKPESPISPLPRPAGTEENSSDLDSDWWCLFTHADQAHAKKH